MVELGGGLEAERGRRAQQLLPVDVVLHVGERVLADGHVTAQTAAQIQRLLPRLCIIDDATQSISIPSWSHLPHLCVHCRWRKWFTSKNHLSFTNTTKLLKMLVRFCLFFFCSFLRSRPAGGLTRSALWRFASFLFTFLLLVFLSIVADRPAADVNGGGVGAIDCDDPRRSRTSRSRTHTHTHTHTQKKYQKKHNKQTQTGEAREGAKGRKKKMAVSLLFFFRLLVLRFASTK